MASLSLADFSRLAMPIFTEEHVTLPLGLSSVSDGLFNVEDFSLEDLHGRFFSIGLVPKIGFAFILGAVL